MAGADPAILRKILDESGLQYAQTAKSYIFNCPRCSGKKKLYIRKEDGRFVCFVCKETDNYQGRAEFALADLLSLSLTEVKFKLYGYGAPQAVLYLDIHLKDFFGDDDDQEQYLDTEAPEISWPLDYFPIDHRSSAKGLAYLETRGIPKEIALEYGLRYCPQKSRVVFPVSSHGSLYGYQERWVGKSSWIEPRTGALREPVKILSSPGIPRDRMVMFSDRIDGFNHAVLTEGPIDAIKAHLCGGNVAAMGKAVSSRQFQLLLNSGVKKVYLGLDPDAADEINRLVRNYYSDVELYEMMAVSGSSSKPDLGAMDYKEVLDLFLGSRRIEVGRVFVFLKDFHRS